MKVPSRWVFALLAVACLAASSLADTIRIDTSPYSNGIGGEFKITPLTGFAGITGMPSDLSSDTFQTFCVDSETFNPGSTYSFTITKNVVASGVALTDGAAWLYTEFRKGTLSGYFGANRQTNAGALQDAIWYFMSNPNGSSNAFVTMAQNALGNTGFGTANIGNVRVLNLYDGHGNNIQDQLTMIPLPAPLGIGFVGLLGMGYITRRWRS